MFSVKVWFTLRQANQSHMRISIQTLLKSTDIFLVTLADPE